MRQFNFVIKEYLKTKDNNLLTSYAHKLKTEVIKSDMYYSWFYDIRHYIVTILLEPKGHPYYTDVMLLVEILSYIDLTFTEDPVGRIGNLDSSLQNFIYSLAEKAWPEQGKTLRILYGKD